MCAPVLAQRSRISPSFDIGTHASLILFRIETEPVSVFSNAEAIESISKSFVSSQEVDSARLDRKCCPLNGRRKPNEPIEKLSTGGHSPWENRLDTWRIVPSPPNVTTNEVCSGRSEVSSIKAGNLIHVISHCGQLRARKTYLATQLSDLGNQGGPWLYGVLPRVSNGGISLSDVCYRGISCASVKARSQLKAKLDSQ